MAWVLVGLLCLTLAMPAGAANLGQGLPSKGQAIGIIVAAIAIIVVVVALVVTHKKKITGCVNASDRGMSITDENDKQLYLLSGSTADIKAGERVRLQGKKIKSHDKGGMPVWQVEKVAKHYGTCHP